MGGVRDLGASRLEARGGGHERRRVYQGDTPRDCSRGAIFKVRETKKERHFCYAGSRYKSGNVKSYGLLHLKLPRKARAGRWREEERERERKGNEKYSPYS